LADWYVYQHDGPPLGPWSSERIASSILSGELAPDVWVAAPSGDRWLRAPDVPVIAALLHGVPTRPRRRQSGLRLVPGTFTEGEGGKPSFAATAMMTGDAVDPTEPSPEYPVSSPAATRKATRTAFERGDADDAPKTERSLPPAPSSPSPSSPAPRHRGDGDTLASPVSPAASRRRKNG
jgi:hypothetical protein